MRYAVFYFIFIFSFTLAIWYLSCYSLTISCFLSIGIINDHYGHQSNYYLDMYPKGHLRLRGENVTWSCTRKATQKKKCDLVMLPKRPPTRLQEKKCDLVMYPKGHLGEKNIAFLIYCSTPLWFCSLTQCIDLIYKLTQLFKVQSFIAKS